MNLKDTLADVSWQEATTKFSTLNTIAVLVFHINYYVQGVMAFLQGNPLTIKDKFSFNLPPVQSESDWEDLRNKLFADANQFAMLIEQLPDNKLEETFFEEKYGTYGRNLLGIIEHTHYHLGQIVLIKKLLRQGE